jgi:hypothetical protein
MEGTERLAQEVSSLGATFPPLGLQGTPGLPWLS